MNDEIARTHQEIATRNARAAVQAAETTKAEMTVRLNHLEHLVAGQQVKLGELEQKYNLLLTKRFDGRATAG